MIEVVLYLAAFIHARSRRARMKLSDVMAVKLRDQLATGELGEDRWDRIRNSEIRSGIDPDSLPQYTVAMRMAAQGEWAPWTPRALQVLMIPEMHKMILSGLEGRTWSSVMTDPENGGFVTSDSPLAWGNPGDAFASLSAPALEVTFPVTKAVALVSVPGLKGQRYEATDEVLARVNAQTVFNSTGQVFHSLDNFFLARDNLVVDLASRFFEHRQEMVRRSRRRS